MHNRIQDRAVFFADSHFLPSQKDAFEFFETLIAKPPPQVFFMGDVFHLLIGHIPSSVCAHKPLLDLIHQLSQKCEVFYFEGNHDFALPAALLPRVKLYPRILQPASFQILDSHFLLAHGDFLIPGIYEFYIQMMNSPLTLSLLKILDIVTLGRLYAGIARKIAKKPIQRLKDDTNFYHERKMAYQNYLKKFRMQDFYGILEGHFHANPKNYQIPKCDTSRQDIQELLYLPIPSYHCDKKGLRCLLQPSYIEFSVLFLESL